MPELFLTQPAASSIWEAFCGSEVYFGVTSSVCAQVPVGSGEFVKEPPFLKNTESTIAWRSSAQMSAWRTFLSLKNLEDGTAGFSWKVATSTVNEGKMVTPTLLADSRLENW